MRKRQASETNPIPTTKRQIFRINGNIRFASESCPAIHPKGDVSKITTEDKIALMRALSSGAIDMITNDSIRGLYMVRLIASINTLVNSSQ